MATAPDEVPLAIDERIRHRGRMAVITIFMLGIANFALHRAVLESGHPLLGQSAWFTTMLGGKATLVLEFIVLIAAMALSRLDYGAAVWAYAAYSGLNGLAAWLILSGRV